VAQHTTPLPRPNKIDFEESKITTKAGITAKTHSISNMQKVTRSSCVTLVPGGFASAAWAGTRSYGRAARLASSSAPLTRKSLSPSLQMVLLAQRGYARRRAPLMVPSYLA
jgi:hypothetical protein